MSTIKDQWRWRKLITAGQIAIIPLFVAVVFLSIYGLEMHKLWWWALLAWVLLEALIYAMF